MKAKISLAAILLILPGIFFSCREENISVEIPFTEYSPADTDCQWTNLNYNNSIIVVNSKTELEKYVTCAEVTYPEIDFAQHTLLLASGGTQNGIGEIKRTLIKKSENEYTLKITVHLGITMVAQGWVISIITPKISDKSNVILDVTQTYN